MVAIPFTADDAARLMYNAATDNTHRLRYLAGPDIEQLVNARIGKTDEEYQHFLRGIFRPNSFKN